MARIRAVSALAVAALAWPMAVQAANFCVAVSDGFGNGGTSFIAPSFTLPAKNHCAPWAGFTKTASTVVLTASGAGCVASDGKVLTLTLAGTDTPFLGAGAQAIDQIQLCATGVTGCPVQGQDQGFFSGPAAEQNCTAGLLTLPPTHD